MALRAAGKAPFLHLNSIGETVPSLRPTDGAFHPTTTGTGLVLHLVTSALGGIGYGLIAETYRPARVTLPTRLLLGLGWGAAFWATWGLVVGPSLDPCMLKMAKQGKTYQFGHLLFGAVTALTLWPRRSRQGPVTRQAVRERASTR